MISGKSTAVGCSMLMVCLVAMAAWETRCLEDLDALTDERSGVAEVHRYLDSKPGDDARNELLMALREDARFAEGTKAREHAILALASVRAPDRSLLLDSIEQIELLLDAALDDKLSVSVRTEVIKRFPALAQTKPREVQDAVREVLYAHDPRVVLSACEAVSKFKEGTPELLSTLFLIAVEPERHIPQAIEAGEALDRERQHWPRGVPEMLPSTTRGRICAAAATAWASLESPTKVLDKLSTFAVDNHDAWGVALLAPLVDPRGKLVQAGPDTMRAWLELLGEIIAQPDASRVAGCCVRGTMLHFVWMNPDLKEPALAALRKIAAGHQDDPIVQASLEMAIQVLEQQ